MSGGAGAAASMAWAIAGVAGLAGDRRPARRPWPGSSSHTATSTPSTPATAPPVRSRGRPARREGQVRAREPDAAGRGPGRRRRPPRRTPTATSSRRPRVGAVDAVDARSAGSGRPRPARAPCPPTTAPGPRARAGSRRRPPTTRRATQESATTSSTVHRPLAADARAAAEPPGHGPSRRAEVRNPVWATMRWSGRTAWPSTCHVRVRTSIGGGQLEVALLAAPPGAWPPA